MTAPKLFMSYSWSTPAHEQWVIDLATELRESGVDVILDKWDLKEGHDAVAFMEQMVTNQDIKKVAIVSDKTYASKADGRAGGVGTETQIISKEVYEKQDQNKFVAVLPEKDDHGKPYLPTYYKSRIYIDLSEQDKYSENFEKLLRWVFDKPLYEKPPLGEKPAYLDEGEHRSLGTTPAFKRCVDAIKNSKPYAYGAFDEYCGLFAQNLERFRLSGQDGEFDDAVISSIQDFLPYRNELIHVFYAVAQYCSTGEFIDRIHRFFESIIPYMDRPANVRQWNEWDFDNLKFIVHELFLYAIAILLKQDRLEQAAYLLERKYYLPENADLGKDPMVGYVIFYDHLKSLRYRNDRLRLGRSSLRADMLKDRSAGTGIEFRHLMQADFIAFIRAEIESSDDWNRWWPETLLYLGHFNRAFEVFARSTSRAYFQRAKALIAIESPTDLAPLFESYKSGKRSLPKWDFNSFNPIALVGYEQLAKRA
jgi:hypothetical protein